MTSQEARTVPREAAGHESQHERHVNAPARVGPIEVAIVVGLVALGAVIRAHGFTSGDLWFDDAWAAAPARVGFSAAIHMVLTAPGYGLALRSWIRLDPATTWFAQLPAYVLGLAAIPAVWGLLRRLHLPRWSALGAAGILAVGPLAVQYSTRVKEGPFDLLAACVLLVLAERVREVPSARRLWVLAGSSVVAFAMSAGPAPVIAGVWLAVIFWGVTRTRGSLARLSGPLAGMAVGCALVWVVFLRRLPGVLSFNWRRRGFLVDYRSFSLAERTVTMIFGGFVHAVLAYPVPASFFNSKRGFHALSAALIGAVLLAVAIVGPIAIAARRKWSTAALPSALAMAVAVLLAVADRVPLGDGRTDEVLYPAFLVCLASVAVAVTPRVARAVPKLLGSRVARSGLAAIALGGVTIFGLSHEAVYPTVSLRGIDTQLRVLERPGDVVFVDTFNSFAWCYYELSACRFQAGGTPVWPQGFRPVSTSRDVFIAAHYGIPLPEITAAMSRARAIWYVGFTYGTYDVGAGAARADVPVATYMTGLLQLAGWHPAPPSKSTVIIGLHVYAVLYVKGS
jgi:hypothetical protein